MCCRFALAAGHGLEDSLCLPSSLGSGRLPLFLFVLLLLLALLVALVGVLHCGLFGTALLLFLLLAGSHGVDGVAVVDLGGRQTPSQTAFQS